MRNDQLTCEAANGTIAQPLSSQSQTDGSSMSTETTKQDGGDSRSVEERTPPRRRARDFDEEMTPERCSVPTIPEIPAMPDASEGKSMWELWGVIADGEWDLAARDLSMGTCDDFAGPGSGDVNDLGGGQLTFSLDSDLVAEEQSWSIDAEYDLMFEFGSTANSSLEKGEETVKAPGFASNLKSVLGRALLGASGAIVTTLLAAEMAWRLGPEPLA
eukprot:TRINITY_DN79328_c0_g1_i1.p1 TRINITY_DN79328_c0_g1~~TRINITY_DN79328_c0_g1_i1.p1  ORF type:complete len:216 (+),score=47.02 TRINITY_DN79328_c0_g1_i1:75-722(+)